MSKISVIIPVYNEEKHLGQCLSSISNQTLKEIEVIIVDDGSNDNSLSIAEEFQKTNSFPTRIIRQKNTGAGAARNKGLDLAKGEFIKFVDADDFLYNDTLEKMYNLAKKNDADIIRGNFTLISDDKVVEDNANWWPFINQFAIIDPKVNKDFIIIEIPGVGNKLFKKNLFDDFRFPENLKWEDLAVVPVLLAIANKVVYLNESVYNYRIDDNTTATDFKHSTKKILDIITIVDLFEENMKIKGVNTLYHEQIVGIYILHSLFRVENVMSWENCPMPFKVTIINSIINLVELKYPNWKDSKYINMYRKANSTFNNNMKKLDSYLKQELRSETDDKKIRQTVDTLFE